MKKLSPGGRLGVLAAAWAGVLASCVFAGYAFAGRDRLPSTSTVTSPATGPGTDTCTGAGCAIGAVGISSDGGFRDVQGGVTAGFFASANGATFSSNGTTVVAMGSGSTFPIGSQTLGAGSNRWNGVYSSAAFDSSVASGSDAFKATTNGARFHFGAGASDYASSDGTTVTFASPLTSTGALWGKTVIAVGNSGYTIISGTFPTVTSAGTSPTIVASGTAAMRVNVGTGGTATTLVLAMPAATTGWNCFGNNITAAAANRSPVGALMLQSSTTTAATLQYQTVSTGAALAFAASDILAINCMAY